MSPADSRRVQLIAELRADWAQVRARLVEAQATEPARSPADAAYVALALHHAYQGFETLLLRLERALGLPERIGPTWHVAILSEAALPLAGLRPAVYPAEAARDWQALLGFRHFLRHAYGVALDPEELGKSVVRLARAVEATSSHMQALLGALAAPPLSE